MLQSYKLCKVLCAMLVIPALFGAAPALAATHSYITGGSNSCKSLAVIDTSTHTEIARIPMENTAAEKTGVLKEHENTPYRRLVDVLRTDVGVVDTATNSELAPYTTLFRSLVIPALFGAAPALAATHSYITGGSNSCKSLAVIDTSTHTEIARIPMENAAAGTGGIPTELAITPDGRFVYVLRTDVGVVDTATNAEVAAIPSPDGCGYSDAKSHIVMSPTVSAFSDADGDGVADSIDTGHGTFSDGTTSGAIVDAGGLQVRVEDVPDPAGVRIRVGPGSGQATFSLCTPGFGLQLAPGSE